MADVTHRGLVPASTTAATVVAAYGGVVARTVDGTTRVAVVHRPRYDDWSLPKGKAEPGESPEDTARREVEEETGCRCRLGRYLGQVSYALPGGATKLVGFWAMTVEQRHDRRADAEVDEVAWWTPANAAARLTHPQDRQVLGWFMGTDPP